MAPEELSRRLQRAGDVVLFDVREPDEHAVSRIPGAVRVDPATTTQSFLGQHAKALAGKTAVFYCSVGVRSSALAASVQKELVASGTTGIHNLRGGIFGWHNAGRALEDSKGATPLVHPYDAHWGKLVVRHDLTTTTPRN